MYGGIPREARLTLLTGQSALGSDFALRQREQTLGRQPDCDIVLAHPTVSGRHARIFFSDGEFFIEDLGSTNGTAVNHRAISGPVVLRSGDVVQVGEVHLQFTDDLGATIVEPPAQASFSAPPPESAMTEVEPAHAAWGASAAFSGEERVSWGQTVEDAAPLAEWSAEAVPEAPGEPASSVPVDLAAAPPAAEATSADVVAEARTVLAALAARVDDLQRDVAAVTEAAGRVEALLNDAETQRNEARAGLARLRDGVQQLADAIEAQASQLGIESVLANLDGLASSPNDLGLLVNVSRDAARYAALVRLVQDVSARLRALDG
jgi:pSer/pThr/pTyr-binding forkhead associated (FHA) protein